MDLFNKTMDSQKIPSAWEPTYVPTYLPAYLPTYLPTNLPWAGLTRQPAVARQRFLCIDFAKYQHEGKGSFFIY